MDEQKLVRPLALMTDIPPIFKPARPILTLVIGMLVANLAGDVLLFGVTALVSRVKGDAQGALALPSFLLLPFIVGVVAAWFYRRLNRSIGITFLDALWVSLVGVGAAWIVLREGVVCLIIVFPALYLLVAAGLLLGRLWFRPNYTKLQLSIFPLLLLVTVTDAFYGSGERAVATDELLIHATPDKVWPHVLAFPDIPDRPDYWIFRLGLPLSHSDNQRRQLHRRRPAMHVQ